MLTKQESILRSRNILKEIQEFAAFEKAQIQSAFLSDSEREEILNLKRSEVNALKHHEIIRNVLQVSNQTKKKLLKL